MDLQALNSGPTPIQKEWLNPICGTVTAGSFIGGPNPGPAVYSQYSQTSGIVVGNTVLGSLTDTATFVGSLTIPPLPVGAVVKITATGLVSVLNTDSINFALYVDGKQATSPTSFPAAGGNVTNQSLLIDSYIRIGATGTAASLNAQVNTSANYGGISGDHQLSITWNRTLPHIIDIFANMNVANLSNNVTCSTFIVELSNVS